MVECQPSKLNVAGSNPVSRSKVFVSILSSGVGPVAEILGSISRENGGGFLRFLLTE